MNKMLDTEKPKSLFFDESENSVFISSCPRNLVLRTRVKLVTAAAAKLTLVSC